jgi:hypothetical protein
MEIMKKAVAKNYSVVVKNKFEKLQGLNIAYLKNYLIKVFNYFNF